MSISAIATGFIGAWVLVGSCQRVPAPVPITGEPKPVAFEALCAPTSTRHPVVVEAFLAPDPDVTCYAYGGQRPDQCRMVIQNRQFDPTATLGVLFEQGDGPSQAHSSRIEGESVVTLIDALRDTVWAFEPLRLVAHVERHRAGSSLTCDVLVKEVKRRVELNAIVAMNRHR